MARIFALIVALGIVSSPAVAKPKNELPPAPPPPQGPIEYLQSLAPWTTVEPPADFVRSSRPQREGAFMPTGLTPDVSDIKVRSDAELAATKAELTAARTAHEAIKAAPPKLTAAPLPPAAAPPPLPAVPFKPSKKASKRKLKPAAVAAGLAN